MSHTLLGYMKKLTKDVGSNSHLPPEVAVQFAPVAPSPKYSSTTMRSIERVVSFDVSWKFSVPVEAKFN